MTLTAEKPVAAEQQVPPAPVATATDAPVAPAIVLAAIRCDCLHEPGRYLDEVRVPFGGE